MAQSWITVANIPPWIPVSQLLSADQWKNVSQDAAHPIYEARLEQSKTALIKARLRGIVIDGRPITVSVNPRLKRSQEKAGSLQDARLRRQVSAGFKKSSTRLDHEGHFSLTPEEIALSIANDFGKGDIVDACCGAGGNAIAFARKGCRVKAYEVSPQRLLDAKHNAKVYGVESRIEFIQQDSAIAITNESADLLWIDPPWGDYDKSDCQLSDFPLLESLLTNKTYESFKQIWVKLPPAFKCSSLPNFKPNAIFGVMPGDCHRIKFILLKHAPNTSL